MLLQNAPCPECWPDDVFVGERPYCCASFPLWCLGCWIGLGMSISLTQCWNVLNLHGNQKATTQNGFAMEHDWFPWPDSLILGQTSWLFFWRIDAFGFLGYLAVVMKHLGVSVNLASWGAPCKQINDADGYMIHQDDIVRILIVYDTLWYTHTVIKWMRILFLVGLMICKFVFRDNCCFRWFIPEVDSFMATVRRLIQCIEILAVVSDMS